MAAERIWEEEPGERPEGGRTRKEKSGEWPVSVTAVCSAQS